MNLLIPNIEREIEKKLKELKLKPEISVKKFLSEHKDRKHRYFSLCKKNGKKIVFYARLHQNQDAKEKFIQEIEFLKKIKETNLEIKNFIPKILDWRIEKNFEWFEREYLKANPLGFSRNINKKFSLETANQIAEIIFKINKINPAIIKLKHFNSQNYLPLSHYNSLAERKIISKNLYKKILKIIKNNLSLLEKENHYFCHGDLNLGNILSGGKKIWIIDWELIHINNFAYDIGYFWSHLWQANKKIRKAVIHSFLKKLPKNQIFKFKKILPIVVSYFSLGGIEYKKEREKEKILIERRKFYLKLLENCAKNFETLINT